MQSNLHKRQHEPTKHEGQCTHQTIAKNKVRIKSENPQVIHTSDPQNAGDPGWSMLIHILFCWAMAICYTIRFQSEDDCETSPTIWLILPSILRRWLHTPHSMGDSKPPTNAKNYLWMPHSSFRRKPPKLVLKKAPFSELQGGSQDLATPRVLGKGHEGQQGIRHEASEWRWTRWTVRDKVVDVDILMGGSLYHLHIDGGIMGH